MFTVLVVDDDWAIQDLIAAALAPLGYQVEPATDGRQALAYLQTECPDLILLDLWMPGMDGLAFARALRELCGDAASPVIAMTADDEPDVRQELGACAILPKPFHIRTLLATIQETIGARQGVK